MTAEPPAARRRSRHRRPPRRSRGAAVLGAAGLGTAAALFALSLPSHPSGAGARPRGAQCAPHRSLRVAVAPELLAPVRLAVAAFSVPRSAAGCSRVTVAAAQPADVVTQLRAPGRRPDVWIPDSSLWLDRARAAGWPGPAAGPSLASSPVVLAGPDRLLGPARSRDVAGLVRAGVIRARLALGDPLRSAPAVGGLLAVERALRTNPAELAAVLRGAALAGATPPVAPSVGGARLVATSEQALGAGPARGTRGIGYVPTGMVLDYPFLALSTDPAARTLLASLLGGRGAAALRTAGFGPPAPDEPGGGTRSAVPSAGAIDRALRTLRSITAPSRLLAVLDVSGSMGARVPGAGGASRLDLVTAAASRGLALYPDAAEIGLWVFASDLGPGRDYRELVPIGPLGARADGTPGRQRLVEALGMLPRVPRGATGLYDTTLAAVRAVRRGWDPGRANSVVLLTDGRDEDPAGLDLAGLLRALRREAGSKPVPVSTIAYGAASDGAALSAISRATGGRLYAARDPRQIAAVFLDAVGRRACPDRC